MKAYRIERMKIKSKDELRYDLKAEDEKLVLSSGDRDRLMAMLDNPPEPNGKLISLFRKTGTSAC